MPSGIVSDVCTVREIRNAGYVLYNLTSQSANVRIEGSGITVLLSKKLSFYMRIISSTRIMVIVYS